MKTSKASFNRFKAEFLRWVGIFGLKGYRIYFHHKDIDALAQLEVSESNKIATASMATEISPVDKESFSPEGSAKHEAVHLLLNKLRHIGSCRYISEEELMDEWERLAIILERAL